MNIELYHPVEDHFQRLDALVAAIYAERYPTALFAKGYEARKVFAVDNPFWQHATYESWIVSGQEGDCAHASIFFDHRMSNIAHLGFFESHKDQRSCTLLFDHVRARVRELGCNCVRGPINGTVWGTFRISFPEDQAPFLFEPFTRAYYRDYFQSYGFRPVYKGSTTIISLKEIDRARFSHYARDAYERGYHCTLLRPEDIEKYSRDIHVILCDAFAGSWSWVAISYEEFLFLFRDAFCAATHMFGAFDSHGDLVGFLFGAEDSLCVHEQRRLVLKTIAVHPKVQNQHIGSALFDAAFDAAAAQGISDILFSTMHTENTRIHTLTGRHACQYRWYEACEYTL